MRKAEGRFNDRVGIASVSKSIAKAPTTLSGAKLAGGIRTTQFPQRQASPSRYVHDNPGFTGDASSEAIGVVVQQIPRGMGLYLQQLATGAFSVPLASAGMHPVPTDNLPTSAPPAVTHEAQAPVIAPQHPIAAVSPSNTSMARASDTATIAATIESFLKDVEPPQREPKTYEEYCNVLRRFRDQCKKVYVKDIIDLIFRSISIAVSVTYMLTIP